MIRFKKDVCDYLRLPDVPKKKWDGNTSFEHGVAIVETKTDEQVYAVVTFDSNSDEQPRILKAFGYDIITTIVDVFVVPAYMEDNDIDEMDLDEESKKRVKEMSKEAKDIENAVAFFFALIFGIVSPNMMTSTVMTAVDTQASRSLRTIITAIDPMEDAAMLTRLLPIRIALSASSKRPVIFSAVPARFEPSSRMFSSRSSLQEE